MSDREGFLSDIAREHPPVRVRILRPGHPPRTTSAIVFDSGAFFHVEEDIGTEDEVVPTRSPRSLIVGRSVRSTWGPADLQYTQVTWRENGGYDRRSPTARVP